MSDSIAIEFDKAAECAGHFIQSAAYTALSRPYEGARQLAEQNFSVKLPQLELFQVPDTDDTFSAAGSFVVSAGESWLIKKGLGKFTPLGATCARSSWQRKAVKAGLKGLMESVNPLPETEDFRDDISFAAYGATTGKLNELTILGLPGRRTLASDCVVNGLSGAAGSLASIASDAVFRSKIPTAAELLSENARGAQIGMAMAGLDHEHGMRQDPAMVMYDMRRGANALENRLWGFSELNEPMQKYSNRVEFLRDYAGSQNDLKAYSAGFLARLPAIQAGLPAKLEYLTS